MNQEKIGKFIKDLRKKNNLTQRELADKYNVDSPIIFAVNDIINGDVSPQYAVNSLFNRELKAEVELDFPKENY